MVLEPVVYTINFYLAPLILVGLPLFDTSPDSEFPWIVLNIRVWSAESSYK